MKLCQNTPFFKTGVNGFLCHSRVSGDPDTFTDNWILDARLRGHDRYVGHKKIFYREASRFNAGSFTKAVSVRQQ